MAINFTDSPADGATQVISGRTYTYNSAKNKWDTTATEVVGPTATVYATVDNLPGTATTGDQAFVTATNRLYIWNGSGWYNIALINNTPTISGANSAYALASDGTATTVTLTATDPEGLAITYSIASDTSGSIATVTQGTGANANVFTITPSTTEANAGTFSLTFRASDGVNIASAVSSFTLRFSVQNQKYTSALITATDNGYVSNKIFRDSSGNNHSITVTGDAAQNTFSPYRHAGYSTYFDGNGDYLNVPYTASNFGTSDFTLEAWVYNTVQDGTNYNVIFDTRGGGTANAFVFGITASGPYAYYYDGAEYASSTTVPLNQWVHLAIVRSGSTVKIYQDGVEVLSRTDSSNLTGTSTGQVTIGRAVQGLGHFNGYLSDLRIVKGTAVYTSAFTPPTERLTAITSTSLLTCHLPYLADGSTNGHTITRNGNTKTQAVAPYDTQEYSAGDHGGSVYLDGTGDRLTVGSTTDLGFGTGDFTIEYWIKHEGKLSGSNYPYAFDMRSQDNEAKLALYHRTNVNNIVGIYVSQNTIVSGTNQMYDGMDWVHYAICKTGGYLKGYFNGKQDFSVADTTDYGSSGQISIGSTYSNLYHMQGQLADFRVVKGTAVYTGEFTPPTAPLTAITNTSLLLPFDDATIIDKSQSIKSITLNGDTTISSAQTKHLNYSMYFDGTGDSLDLYGGLGNFGTEDFTIELWAYASATGSYAYLIEARNSGSQNNAWTLSFNYMGNVNNDILQFATFNGSSATAFLTSNTAFPTGTWKHIAVARSGTTMKMFFDGTEVASNSSAGFNFALSQSPIHVGKRFNNVNHFNGYMSDIRITKGLARYTANFTPPAAALKG